jgi:integrase
MARRIRSTVETRSARLALPIAKKPTFARLGPGISLGYRRNATAGTWVVRVADGKGSNWTKVFGTADDYQDADGTAILTYLQATDKARALARTKGTDTSAVVTVSDALDAHEADLEARGGDKGNVSRARGHVSTALARRPVAMLTANELRNWKNGLVKVMAAASVNRVANTLRAALNLAADNDEHIPRGPWESGLKSLPGAESADNVVLPDVEVRRIIAEAYRAGEAFGLFVEVAAVTGARPSQICRIECGGAQRDHVMVPASAKGKPGSKKITHRRVPVDGGLARRLLAQAKGRGEREPLLRKPSGEPWAKSDHTRPFRRVAERTGLDPEEVTIYALRHSSIVRQLHANVPIRLVAVMHDTSVAMIERHYSAHIDQHVDDAIVRQTSLKFRRTTQGGLTP